MGQCWNSDIQTLTLGRRISYAKYDMTIWYLKRTFWQYLISVVIRCRELHCKPTYYQCVKAVGYSLSMFTLEKIVGPVYFARRIFNVDPYTKVDCRANVFCSSDIWCRLLHYRKSSTQCIMFVQYSMSIITPENIVKPTYYPRPIFDVGYYTRGNSCANVLCLSDIWCRLLH